MLQKAMEACSAINASGAQNKVVEASQLTNLFPDFHSSKHGDNSFRRLPDNAMVAERPGGRVPRPAAFLLQEREAFRSGRLMVQLRPLRPSGPGRGL